MSHFPSVPEQESCVHAAEDGRGKKEKKTGSREICTDKSKGEKRMKSL